ncbi:histidinol-phosphate transaminase [Maridesulfovibrio salexigens]|uniref:Histidinol-phosphate aminotransferase n=1 Tax=Maridesulfovibrio salexigens (strain ATCC 14822 / DSM 2638 / NCIMB 8403 / VKM B-1763) TaxID=526222 RepID=C6BVN4_MARSD|nr:histidinol-phosphate transaminase [Maridesulfovibrio salexigens]ACS78248.1 histidinol-phosphate aminotransferase [Maridesulfovibrio salexigens DSM 2638]
MSAIKVRSDMMDSKPYAPGLTIEEIKEKYGLDTVIKLASNENPLGASPMAQKAINRHAPSVFRYPHNGNPRLNAAIAKRTGVSEEQIISGNGSDEVLDLLVRIKANPGQDEVITYESCFSMYRLMSHLCAVNFRQIPREEGHKQPLKALTAAVSDKTALVFLTSPDNPTGLAVTVDEVREMAASIPEQTLLVIDEAYIEFARPADKYDMRPLLEEYPNIVLTRTFSKAYGLAGLRIGYGIMSKQLAEYIKSARAPFTVNLLAEEAAIAVLEDEAFFNTTMDVVLRGRELFTTEIRKMGCEVLDSQANFIMFKPTRDAMEVFEELLKRGIIVRPLKSFGLGEYIRVNMGTDHENKVFLETLKEVL